MDDLKCELRLKICLLLLRHGNSHVWDEKKIDLSHLNQHMTKCGPEGEGNNVTKFVVLLNHKPNPKKILLLEQG